MDEVNGFPAGLLFNLDDAMCPTLSPAIRLFGFFTKKIKSPLFNRSSRLETSFAARTFQ